VRRAVWILLLLTSCVRADWRREHAFDALGDDALSALAPDESTLEECLDLLGAPLMSWEVSEGAALAWGWRKSQRIGGTVTVPLTDFYSPSFTGRFITADMRGAVLIFDETWTLRLVRRGRLLEVANYGRQRPALLESE
jgi:hypothetical protein